MKFQINQDSNSAIIEVVALALSCEGYFMLARRNSLGSGAGEWEFPGGKIEVGESQVQALVREIVEELGYDLRGLELCYWGENLHAYPSKKVRIYLWRVETEHRPEFRLSDHDQVGWFLPAEISQLNLSAGDKAFISLINAYSKK